MSPWGSLGATVIALACGSIRGLSYCKGMRMDCAMLGRRGDHGLPGLLAGRLHLPTLERRLFLRTLSELVERLAYYRRLEQVWNLIEQRYWETDLCLDAACHRGGISRGHLNHLLRRTTSFTFHALLSRYRVRQAVHMIWQRNYSLSHVAARNGFGSVSSFERNFSKLLGLRPVDYRRTRLDLLHLHD